MTDKVNFNRIKAGLAEVLEIVEGRAEAARVYAPAQQSGAAEIGSDAEEG